MSRWFRLQVLVDYLDNINEIDTFLGQVGRQKMIRPIYSALKIKHLDVAIKIFAKYKNFYHPLAAKAIARDLDIKEEKILNTE